MITHNKTDAPRQTLPLGLPQAGEQEELDPEGYNY
jgi:hypothetical protein